MKRFEKSQAYKIEVGSWSKDTYDVQIVRRTQKTVTVTFATGQQAPCKATKKITLIDGAEAILLPIGGEALPITAHEVEPSKPKSKPEPEPLAEQVKAAVNALRPLTIEETRLAAALNSSANHVIGAMMSLTGPVKLSPIMRRTVAASGQGGGGCNPAQVKEVLLDLGYKIYKDPDYTGHGPRPELISK